MKKVFFGLFAIAIAVAGVAFTNVKNVQNNNDDTYWFAYTEDGSAIVPLDAPATPPTSNPFNCPGLSINCASEYTGFQNDPLNPTKIIPAGTLLTTLKKN